MPLCSISSADLTPLYKYYKMSQSLAELTCIPLQEIRDAKERIAGRVPRSPLIPLDCEVPGKKIYLKLENLQPTNSFKLRGACNAIRALPACQLKDGVFTGSAGNFAQGLAWMARSLQVPCEIIVPDNAPQTKVDSIQRLGAGITKVPYDIWWSLMVTHQYPGMKGHFIHPVCNRNVIAGHGTIALELLKDLPEVDTVICPFGGGGLSSGIASALAALKPAAKVYACEVEHAAPLEASLKAGHPVTLQDRRASFVDGMGGKAALVEMWNMVSTLLHGPVVLSLEQIRQAIQLLVERSRVVAEGAGAAPVAAALTDDIPEGNIVCVISGGNIDSDKLVQILQGKIPN